MINPVEKLINSLLKDGEDEAVLITSRVNQRYFTSFPSSDGFVFITKEEAYLLVDFRYAEAAKIKSKNVTVVLFSKMADTLGDLIKKHGIKKIHLENEEISHAQFKKFENLFTSFDAKPLYGNALGGVINSIRAIKDSDAIKSTREAQRLTDEAFTYILGRIKEGVTEKEIALDIEFFMRKNGAEGVAFDLIVVTGTNSSQCHGVPGDTKIQKGDFITMDTGCVVDGYHSDMTRTVAVSSVNDEQKDIYETVLTAQSEAMKCIKAGAVCNEVDKVARDIIDAKYPDAFGHGLGHSLGFEIHEMPRFSKLDKTILKAGMLMTNEPGIYLAGKYGVRIEDLVLVTENGHEILTKSPKNLIIL
ncbi:MAG: aminopeptidase P family protein [Clostridia bacterium]